MKNYSQNRINGSRYNIIKSKIGAFSSKGKQEVKEHRVITTDKMKIDNVFKFKEDYLHHRKSQNYTYEMLDRVSSDKSDFFYWSSRDFAHDFASEFDDDYWENINIIPRPKWIKYQIKNDCLPKNHTPYPFNNQNHKY